MKSTQLCSCPSYSQQPLTIMHFASLMLAWLTHKILKCPNNLIEMSMRTLRVTVSVTPHLMPLLLLF